jgi:hypothetical protein
MNMIRYMKLKRYKNSKFLYFLKNFLFYIVPDVLFRKCLSCELSRAKKYNNDYITKRVNYCNKLKNDFIFNDNFISCDMNDFPQVVQLKNFNLNAEITPHTNFFDVCEYARYFLKNYYFAFAFGDITTVPKLPAIVKSRPIEGNNQNSVLLNLDKVRHFVFIKDKKNFLNKKNILIGRAAVYQAHRIRFWEMYFGHPMCDLGQVNKRNTTHPEWIVEPLSIEEHLDFKFILCLEGNDVATNLKWVMSSNSIAVMPKPTYETWFMEGALIGDYHYIEVKKDYSDLEEKLNYYIEHTNEALCIIENAHRYVAGFQDKRQEKLISLLVLQKYFQHTNKV